MSRYYRKSPMKYILPPEISTGFDVGMASVEALNPELYQSSSTTSTSIAQLSPITFDVGHGMTATLSESGIDLSPKPQYTAQATSEGKTFLDYLPWILVGVLVVILFLRK